MSALASGDHAVCLGYRLSKYPLNRRLEQDEQGRQRPIALAGFSLLSTAGHRLASPHFAQLLAAALFIATAHNYPEHAVKHDLGVVPSYSSSKGQEPQPERRAEQFNLSLAATAVTPQLGGARQAPGSRRFSTRLHPSATAYGRYATSSAAPVVEEVLISNSSTSASCSSWLGNSSIRWVIGTDLPPIRSRICCAISRIMR